MLHTADSRTALCAESVFSLRRGARTAWETSWVDDEIVHPPLRKRLLHGSSGLDSHQRHPSGVVSSTCRSVALAALVDK